jgi:DNA-binding PadR family transcriptional regulator
MNEETIYIEDICRKILKEEVLDIFFIIQTEKEISKIDIQREFKKYVAGQGEGSPQKFRFLVNECISKLEGATFVEFYQTQTSHIYYLTPAGEIAVKIIADLIDEDPNILRGSKVVRKEMEGERNNEN